MFISTFKKYYNLNHFGFFNYSKENQIEIKFSITLEIIKLNDDEKWYVINIRVFNKGFAVNICL